MPLRKSGWSSATRMRMVSNFFSHPSIAGSGRRTTTREPPTSWTVAEGLLDDVVDAAGRRAKPADAAWFVLTGEPPRIAP
jgi:hypothetical protein